jgi:hypothetical protein
LIVRPLFLLLRYREAMDSIDHGLDMRALPADLQDQDSEARKALAENAFRRRRAWKRWVYAGLALLLVALIASLIQGACLAKT